MKCLVIKIMVFSLINLIFFSIASAQECVECHKKINPGIVNDFLLSKHNKAKITCAECHGDQHKTAQDVAKAKIPTPACSPCHGDRVKQFKSGKHALAWAAMKGMPTAHWQPMALMEGMKGCGGCHKIGLKFDLEPLPLLPVKPVICLVKIMKFAQPGVFLLCVCPYQKINSGLKIG